IDKLGRKVADKMDYISNAGQDELHHKPPQNWENPLKIARENQKKLTEYYNDQLVQIPLKQNWRMVLHLGATTAYNNGFLLHKLYGVPYLPGRAIKGVLRHYVVCTYFDSKEKKAWKNPDFQFLFGNEEVETDKASQGKAVFFDVFPANDDFEIEADIM